MKLEIGTTLYATDKMTGSWVPCVIEIIRHNEVAGIYYYKYIKGDRALVNDFAYQRPDIEIEALAPATVFDAL